MGESCPTSPADTMPEQSPADQLAQVVLGELRSLRSEMNQRLDRLVTTEAFAAEQRRVDQRHDALGQDIVDERESRKSAITDLKTQQAKTASNVRWAFAAIVLPTAGLVTTIVLALRGGS